MRKAHHDLDGESAGSFSRKGSGGQKKKQSHFGTSGRQT